MILGFFIPILSQHKGRNNTILMTLNFGPGILRRVPGVLAWIHSYSFADYSNPDMWMAIDRLATEQAGVSLIS